MSNNNWNKLYKNHELMDNSIRYTIHCLLFVRWIYIREMRNILKRPGVEDEKVISKSYKSKVEDNKERGIYVTRQGFWMSDREVRVLGRKM